jgi:mycobactin lysine-N-oxygenase
MTKRIAVIGAGAKAAAIAAKADCLYESGLADLEIVVFEKGETADNWSGDGGFTNGSQLLCTPVERDVGFPYDDVFGPSVSNRMQSHYSWMAFAVQSDDISYGDWINRGSQRLTHREFAAYLRFVFDQAGVEPLQDTTVTRLTHSKGKWNVTTRPTGGRGEDRHDGFDACIITGPGPAIKTFGAFEDPQLFNGEDVWGRLPALEKFVRDSDERVVIVGGGGAAAAIAAWLIDAGFEDREIAIVAQQATLYTRTGGYFENRVFDDEELWSKLGSKEQTEFVNRISRGVVWESVCERLERARKINLIPGRGKTIAVTKVPPEHPRTLTVYYEAARDPDTPIELEGCAVIDAAGFNPWWFTGLLPGQWQHKSRSTLRREAQKLDYHLRFPVGNLPPLHTPVVSHAAGPGYNSLMVLGQMSDRVLAPYQGW